MGEGVFKTEVVIAGGGLVGGALAVALAQAGVAVALVERETPDALLAPEFDGRAFAIALASQKLLAGVGLWDGLRPWAEPILDIRVSDGDSLFFLHYDHKTLGDEPFGWIVEARGFRKALEERLHALPLVRRFAPDQIIDINRSAGEIIAKTAKGAILQAPLAVGAEGRNSYLRNQAGIKVTNWSYNQTGIVTTVRHARPHKGVAQERFLPAGPFAILPLPGGRSSLVWTEPTQIAFEMMSLGDDALLEEIRHRFQGYLDPIGLEGPRFAYPLSLQFAQSYIGQRLALVGDAAHGMHPVAGQGANMGLRDVAALAEVIIEAKRIGVDTGWPVVLERYQRWRRFDNMLMLGITDALTRLFSNDINGLRIARELGLALVSKMGPAKKFFMRHAMGLAGDLPRLMRGEKL